MANLKLKNPSGGSLALVSADGASDYTVTFPAGTGTAAIQGISTNIVSGTAVASTSGTSIDFTGIPSWVKRITVMFQSISTNGTSNIQVQLGTSSGIDATSTYKGACARNGTIGTTNYTTGFLITQTQIASSVIEGSLQLNLLGSNNWTGMGVGGNSDGAAASFTGGSKSLSATLDRVRITTVNGTDTFDAGSINILYE